MPIKLGSAALVLFSAGLMALPFHQGAYWPLAFVALVPFFWALRAKDTADSFRISFLFGVFFYLFTGYSLIHISIAAVAVVVLYLSVYFALSGMLTAKWLVHPRDPAAVPVRRMVLATLAVPAFWVLIEYLRARLFGGVPLMLFGYSQWRNLAVIQMSDVTGVYGVSYLVLLANTAFFQLSRLPFLKGVDAPQKTRLTAALVLMLALSLGLSHAYGAFRLAQWDAYYRGTSAAETPALRVAVVQGNIPQEEKWDARIKGIIFEKYKRLTLMCAVERSDLIVWPETSFPGYLEDEGVLSTALRHLVRQSKTDVLVGAPTVGDVVEQGVRFYNSAVHLSPDGEERARHAKMHLVPFGEFVPLEPIFGGLRYVMPIGTFTEGRRYTIFEVASRYQPRAIKARFGVLICFEDMFPDQVREFVRRGADFLVNITNDAWFGRTTAPYLHGQASIFRAVENRVNVVRAANTGWSCFIRPDGRVADSVQQDGKEIFVTGHKSRMIALPKMQTFYTRFGDVFMALILIILWAAYREKNRQRAYARL